MATPSSPSQIPTILVLGGTGTVGSRVVAQLCSSPRPYRILVASRKGASRGSDSAPTPETARASPATEVRHVRFDWRDRGTWTALFWGDDATHRDGKEEKGKNDAGAERLAAVFLVAPPAAADSGRLLADLIDVARARAGARRFVLLSASSVDAGGPAMGAAHAYLAELGRRGEVEWACLRPTWFQQNFATQPAHVKSIRDEGKVYSATGNGRIPWVSADDIAAVAVRALTDDEAPNTDCLVLGSELLSYADIAAILSQVLGREIVHVNLTAAELAKRHQESGIPEEYANMLAAMDVAIREGSEDRTNDAVLTITGAPPRRFRDFAESVKHVWQPTGSS
ncbi:hypothetical protein VTH06DRAFT_8132 [Thermothelomyces fergusii]